MTNSEAFHQLPLADVPKQVRAELAEFLKAQNLSSQPSASQLPKL